MSSVKKLIEKARIAQQIYESYDQEGVDEVVVVKQVVCHVVHCAPWGESSVGGI